MPRAIRPPSRRRFGERRAAAADAPVPRLLPMPAGLGGAVHALVSRTWYRPGAAYDLHRHACPELFWIEQGVARHRTVEGGRDLVAGDLVFIAADHAHALDGGGTGFVLVNVVIAPALLAALAARHRGDTVRWPWDAAAPPLVVRCDPPELLRLQGWADELAADPTRLAVEAFLLGLVHRHGARRGGRAAPDLPDWLERAILRFGEPARLGAGCAGFVRLAGRSTAHVNRAVRHHLGCTTTALVNRLRLGHASARLRMTAMAIPAIAAECGFASLAHFYRAFAAQYRQTPRRYRREHQPVQVQGLA